MNRTVDKVALALPAIGALNWGLVGLARFDLVARLVGKRFGETNPLNRAVYGLVGVAGVYQAAKLVRSVTD